MVHDVLQNLLRVNEKCLGEALVHGDVRGGGSIPWCSHHCATILQLRRRQKAVGAGWHQQDHSVMEERSGSSLTPKEPRTCENVPVFGTSEPSKGLRVLFIHHSHTWRRRNAHRAGCPADGGCSPQTLR